MAHVPTFVAKGAFASGISAISPAVPAGYRNDDLLLLFVESANQAITAPTGWNEVANSPQGTGTAAAAGGVRLAVFWKIATGAEVAPTVADTGDHQTAIMMAFRGLDPANPIDATAGSVGAATTAMVFPSVTTTQANSLVILAAGMDTDAASTTTMGTVTNANLTGITELHDQTMASGAGGGLAIASGLKATAGSTGTSSATGSTAVTHAYLTIALRTRADAITSPRGQYLNDNNMLTSVAVGGAVSPATDGIVLMSDVSPINSLDELMIHKAEAKTVGTAFNGTASVTNSTFIPESDDLTYGFRGGSMVYDAKNDRYITIFAYDGTTRYNHVWAKDMTKPGQPWRRITPTGTAPVGRNLAGTTYVRGTTSGAVDKAYAITWGGYVSGDTSEMWALDLTTPGSEAWISITQTGTPTARSYITRMMVSTPVTGQASQNYVYLFGGYAGASRINSLERCTFNVNTPNAVTWTTLKANGAAGNPGIREGAILDYKASTGKFYLYGGYSGSAVYNDFWEYDIAGNTWTQITPSGTAPTGTSLGTGGYDPVNNRFWFAAGWQNSQTTTRNHVGYVAGVGDSAATNTYYFNGTVSDPNNKWSNDANIIDGNSSTLATAGGLYNSTQTENYLKLENTNAPTSSNPISQVRARLSGFTSQSLTPMYADIYTDNGAELLGTASLSSTSNAYGSYVTLTTPSGGWSYSKLQTLEAIVYGGNYDGSYGISIVEVEVTQGPLWVEVRAHDADNQAFASSANIASAVDTKRNWIIMKGEMTFDSTERYSYIIDMNEAYTGSAPQPVYGMSEGDWMGARDAPATVWDPTRGEWLIINGFAQMYDEQTIVSGTHVSEVWAYNPTTNTWRYAVKGHKTMPMTEGTVGVYDTTRQRVLLFGGLSGASETHNEVWSLTADQYGMYEYKKLSPTGTPPSARWLCAGVYDSARDRFIIAMGGNDTGPLSTSTLYALYFSSRADGVWTALTPTGTATAVKGPGFAADLTAKRLYIFGGATNAALSTVSSQLVYLDYTNIQPAWVTPTSSSGTARRTPAFGIDTTNGKLITFGGLAGGASTQNLQYWDIASGGAWTTAQPTFQPDARRSPGSMFINGKLYVTHGRTDSSKWFVNTWELTPNYTTPASSTWSDKAPRKYQPNYAYFDPNTAGNYHWQAWNNEDGAETGKASFGGNAESAVDFVLGNVTPSFTKTHSTDTVKRSQSTKSHTTDSDMRTNIHFTKESNATLPTTANPAGTSFSRAEVVNATSDNAVYADVTGAQYLLNVYERWHTNSTDQISATWNGKSTIAASVNPVYLQIWNNTASSWETLASNNTSAADTEFTLTGSKTTNLSNYYQAGNKVVFRVYQ